MCQETPPTKTTETKTKTTTTTMTTRGGEQEEEEQSSSTVTGGEREEGRHGGNEDENNTTKRRRSSCENSGGGGNTASAAASSNSPSRRIRNNDRDDTTEEEEAIKQEDEVQRTGGDGVTINNNNNKKTVGCLSSRQRRGKRDRKWVGRRRSSTAVAVTTTTTTTTTTPSSSSSPSNERTRSGRSLRRRTRSSSSSGGEHGGGKKNKKGGGGGGGSGGSGGIEALIPSAIGVIVMAFAAMARMGFRGRVSVAGIDLGTTNSVICIQALSDTVGQIDCVPDPVNNSPLVPSVVSFPHYHHHSTASDDKEQVLDVIVGHEAKLRIDMHPHSTFYHAKRFLGRPYDSDTVKELRGEVEFDVVKAAIMRRGSEEGEEEEATVTDDGGIDDPNDRMPLVQNDEEGVFFHVPSGYHVPPPITSSSTSTGKMKKWKTTNKKKGQPAGGRTTTSNNQQQQQQHHHNISPEKIGAYVVKHLLRLTSNYLGYDNIQSAVIAVPAKFDATQRRATARAFQMAGIRVARMLEEPTAAALAYGLHRKDGVDHILVYDFGGGTLDVSILHVSDGYVDVMASEGDDTLGGADFDSVIAHTLESRVEAQEVMGRVTMALDGIGKGLRRAASKEKGGDGGDGDGDEEQEEEEESIDVEERLADVCPQTEITPLCHVSSLHSLAEKMKIALSDGNVATEECLGLSQADDADADADPATPLPLPPSLESLCANLRPFRMTLTQSQFDDAVQSLYDRSLLPVRRVLKSLDLTSDDIDEVVMVGGTTRMPMIRQLVKEELKVDALNIEIDPDITVAYGAASVID